jgi:hypothetical protein
VEYLHSNGAAPFDHDSLHRAVRPNAQVVSVPVWLQIRSSSVDPQTVNNVAGHRADTELAGVVLICFFLVPVCQTGLGECDTHWMQRLNIALNGNWAALPVAGLASKIKVLFRATVRFEHFLG